MALEPRVAVCVLALNILACIMLWRFHLQRLANIRRHRAWAVVCFHAQLIARRRAILSRHITVIHQIMHLRPLYSRRRWWCFPRPSNWWRIFVNSVWGDEQGVENFRLPRYKFMWICDTLRSRLECSVTRLQRPISVEERVAIAIWFLDNCTTYRLVCQQFGLARSTVAEIVIEVCLAIELELLPVEVHPGPPAQAMHGFEMLGFLHYVGAINGTHIFIHRPINDPEAYINRKKRHSVVVQGTVKHLGLFVDVAVVNVGHDHNAHILRCSIFFDAMDNALWVPGNPTLTVSGVRILALILGDSAYPLRTWLMTPHGGNLNAAQANLNRAHSRARCVVERAFSRLKGRWHCILDKLYVYEENVNSVICSCIVLHNICEMAEFPPTAIPQPQICIPRQHEAPQVVDDKQQKDSEKVRGALTNMMFHQRSR